MPKLRRQTFETAIIERYRRREASVEEALIAKVVGAFPDGQSALDLAAARLRHVAGRKWSTKRYLSMGLISRAKLGPKKSSRSPSLGCYENGVYL